MAIAAALELDSGLARGVELDRQRAEHAHKIPVALIFGEITEAVVGIEQQIFIPTVRAALGVYFTYLETDYLIRHAVELAARAERDLRFDALLALKPLEDCELGRGCIQYGVAVGANDIQRVRKSEYHHGRAA